MACAYRPSEDGQSKMTVIVAAFIIALGAVDIWLTQLVFKANPNAIEVNPIMRWLMNNAPFDWPLVKISVHVLAAVVVVDYPVMFWPGVMFVAIYAGVCSWNTYILFRKSLS